MNFCVFLYNVHVHHNTSKHIQGIFGRKIEHIDLQKDAVMIIHHILRYGKLKILLAYQTYPRKNSANIFNTTHDYLFSFFSSFCKSNIKYFKGFAKWQQYLNLFDVLDIKRSSALAKLKPVFHEWYLAGGTVGVAVGHRISFDFDLSRNLR